MGAHFCNHCHKGPIPTVQGLCSHITQTAACRQAAQWAAIKWQPIPPTETEAADHPAEVSSDLDIEMSRSDSPGASSDNIYAEFDPPLHQNPPQVPSLSPKEPAEQNSQWATVEDAEDEESGVSTRWIQDFPEPAGVPLQQGKTFFEDVRQKQESKGEDLWAPYNNKDEWELAHWLLDNIGHNVIDQHLKLPIVLARVNLNSFQTMLYWYLINYRLGNVPSHHLRTRDSCSPRLTGFLEVQNGSVSNLS